MKKTFFAQACLNLILSLVAMTPAFKVAAQDGKKPSETSSVHISLSGDKTQRSGICERITPKLDALKIEYYNGCLKPRKDQNIFVFSQEDFVSHFEPISRIFNEEFHNTVKSGPAPRSEFSTSLSWIPCGPIVTCEGMQRRYKCGCP